MPKTSKPATVDIPQAAELLGIGRSVAYELAAKEGELVDGVPVLKIRHRYRVPTAALERVLGVDLADTLADAPV